MKQDEKFRHVSGWFEHISELGASLLVQATGKVFRAHRILPLLENCEKGPEKAPAATPSTPQGNNPKKAAAASNARNRRPPKIDPLDRRSLLSLEYLVTTMFIVQATQPRDAVYALLAIARDAAPFAKSTTKEGDASMLTASVIESFREEKPWTLFADPGPSSGANPTPAVRRNTKKARRRSSQWWTTKKTIVLYQSTKDPGRNSCGSQE